MPKFKNVRPHIKTVMVCDPKTMEQSVVNIAPGGELIVSDAAYAVSHGFKAEVEVKKHFVLVPAPEEVKVEENPDPVEDTAPIDPEEA